MVIALALVSVTGIIDHITGAEIEVAVLYLAPVALASWYVNRRAGVLIALLSSVVWLIANYTTGHPYTHLLLPFWNAMIFLGFFLAVAIMVAAIRSTLRTVQQTLDHLDNELAQAAHYVLSLLPEPITQGDIRIDWRLVPSKTLGGDSLDYHWVDDRHLAIYLIDVCGHGVGAAFHSVSVMNVLRSQSLPDTDFLSPREVLAGLNRMFPMEKHNSMFFTMWYGVYEKSSSNLTYAGAGYPPALLVSEPYSNHTRTDLLQTLNLFVGGMSDVEYDQASCRLDRFCRLYVFSDGVYEATCEDCNMWTFEDFLLFMARSAEPCRSQIDRLFHHVLEIAGQGSLDDDFSILEVSLSHQKDSCDFTQ